MYVKGKVVGSEEKIQNEEEVHVGRASRGNCHHHRSWSAGCVCGECMNVCERQGGG